MELDRNLLQYTVSKKINLVPVSDTNIEASISDISKVNLYPVGGDANVDVITVGGSDVDLFGNISDTELVNLYGGGTKVSTPTNNIKFATTYKNFSPQEISDIKQAIYNLYKSGNLNKGNSSTGSTGGSGGTSGTGSTGGTGGSDGTSGTGSTGGSEGTGGSGTPVEKASFLTDFCDVDTMFDYLKLLSGGEVTKDTGITRAQLVHLTQNEAWEENNSNFWGTLNRIFNVLDTDSTKDVLSYDEIKSFIGEELGEDVADYLNKVNRFTKQLQTEYSRLSNQKKLEFVIARTREYLEAAGLDKQLKALNRLLSETDTYNTDSSIKVGQIVMKKISSDKNGYTTLGSYRSSAYRWEYDDKDDNDNPFTVNSFAGDTDDKSEDFDGGITLNKEMLNYEWYYSVDVLVHELTHATASQWYPSTCTSGRYSDLVNQESVDKLYDVGVLTNEEYQYYKDHLDNMYLTTATEEETEYWNRLMYLLECQWGEYAAYQVDADYVDSIAGDIFNASGNAYGNKSMTTAVIGEDEADIISNHIEGAYNNVGMLGMSIAEFAEAYGYDVSEINDEDGNGIISLDDTITKNGQKISIYSKESKPDYEWATYDKNQNWTWVV